MLTGMYYSLVLLTTSKAYHGDSECVIYFSSVLQSMKYLPQ